MEDDRPAQWFLILVQPGTVRRVVQFLEGAGHRVVYPEDGGISASQTPNKRQQSGFFVALARTDALESFLWAQRALVVLFSEGFAVVDAARHPSLDSAAAAVAQFRPRGAWRIRAWPSSILPDEDAPFHTLLERLCPDVVWKPGAKAAVSLLYTKDEHGKPEYRVGLDLGDAEPQPCAMAQFEPVGGHRPAPIVPRLREALLAWRSQQEAEKHLPRSQHKLREVLLRLKYDGWMDPSVDLVGSHVVDIGAAPGGWTRRILDDIPESRVLAVDGADLRCQLDEDPWKSRVQHFRGSADLLVERVYAGDESVRQHAHSYDLLLCDINSEPRIAMDATRRWAECLLKDGGWIVLTLKLLRRKESKLDELAEQYVQRLRDFHEPALQVRGVYALWTNQCERTVLATYHSSAPLGVRLATAEDAALVSKGFHEILQIEMGAVSEHDSRAIDVMAQEAVSGGDSAHVVLVQKDGAGFVWGVMCDCIPLGGGIRASTPRPLPPGLPALPWLSLVWVDPSVRGQGRASQLYRSMHLEFLGRISPSAPVRASVWLDVYFTNPGSWAFHERIGYKHRWTLWLASVRGPLPDIRQSMDDCRCDYSVAELPCPREVCYASGLDQLSSGMVATWGVFDASGSLRFAFHASAEAGVDPYGYDYHGLEDTRDYLFVSALHKNPALQGPLNAADAAAFRSACVRLAAPLESGSLFVALPVAEEAAFECLLQTAVGAHREIGLFEKTIAS